MANLVSQPTQKPSSVKLSPMRIVVVLEYFFNSSRPIGGAERQMAKLAQRFIERGVGVTVISGQWEWGETRKTLVNSIPVHRLFTFWTVFHIKGLRKFGYYIFLLDLFLYLLLHRNDYDLIHCHSAMPSAFIVAWIGKLLNKRTLVRPMASGSRWGDISRMREQQSLFGSRWMLRKFKDIDCIIALNQDITHELKEIGIDSSKIVLLPNGVETGNVKNKTNYQIGSVIKLIFVGRLHPQKGLDTLLAALKKVRTHHPQLNWQMNFAGEGPLRSELEFKAKELGIDNQIEFLGQVADIFSILYEHDIFVLPSRAEGMSNALLEAMSCSLPCIVSNISANTQLITNGNNGLVVSSDDDEALAEAIIQLTQDQDLRQKLGQAATQTVITHFSIDRIAERYLTVYQGLLSERAG